MRFRPVIVVCLLIAISLLQSVNARNPNVATENLSQQRSLKEGVWGGNSISAEVSDGGVSLEFDCAHGKIAKKVLLDGEGKFEIEGVYVAEKGGPVRVDEDQKGKPAIYTGTSDGKSLTLTIKLKDADEPVGTYNLTHGRTGRIRKCL
jgi:hypothetical protein